MANWEEVWLTFGRLTSWFLRIIGISNDWVAVVICPDFREKNVRRPIHLYDCIIARNDRQFAIQIALCNDRAFLEFPVTDWGFFLRARGASTTDFVRAHFGLV